MMSMYSELLAMSIEKGEEAVDGDRSLLEARLLHELAEHRSRLRQEHAPGTLVIGEMDTPSRIAREIDYDLVLIRLCRLHDIACDPASFTRPLVERRRLELALQAAGVDVHARR